MIGVVLLCLFVFPPCFAQLDLKISNNRYLSQRASDVDLIGVVQWDQRYVAVDALGGVSVSDDYERWRLITRLDPALFESNTRSFHGLLLADHKLHVYQQGALHVSSDGLNWTRIPMRDDSGLFNIVSMAYNDAVYLMGVKDNNGRGRIFSSFDGLDWTQTSYDFAEPETIIFAEGRFFTNSGSFISYSLDGLTWAQVEVAPNDTLEGLAWNGQRFLTCTDREIWLSETGVDGWEKIAYTGEDFTAASSVAGGFVIAAGSALYGSLDGMSWGYVDQLLAVQNWLGLQETDNELLVWSEAGAVVKTQNPIMWPRPSGPDYGLYSSYANVTWDGNQFWATQNSTLYSSTDGMAWQAHALPGTAYAKVAVDGPRYITAGFNHVYLSDDGETWETVFDVFSGYHLATFAYGAGLYVMGGWGNQNVRTSPDGRQWTLRPIPFFLDAVTDVVYNGQQFLAIAGALKVALSVDGIEWEAVAFPGKPREVLWTGSNYVVVGEDGLIATSTDGRNWQIRAQGNHRFYTRVIMTDGVLYAVGSNGQSVNKMVTAISRDLGWTWELDTFALPIDSGADEVYIKDDKLFISDSNRDTYYTSDFETWYLPHEADRDFNTVVDMGEQVFVYGWGFSAKGPCVDELGPRKLMPFSLSRAVYGNDMLVGLGYKSIWVSTDGDDWEQVLELEQGLGELVYANGVFVVTGNDTSLYYSTDGWNWAEADSDEVPGFSALTWTGVRFVAAQTGSDLLWLSDDGAVWTPLDIDTPVSNDLVSNGSQVIMFRNSTALYVSDDHGLTWHWVSVPIVFHTMVVHHGLFVGSGMWFSEDAEHWFRGPKASALGADNFSTAGDHLMLHNTRGAMVMDVDICPVSWWNKAASWPNNQSVLSLLQAPCLPSASSMAGR